jgi:hypothetical protein
MIVHDVQEPGPAGRAPNAVFSPGTDQERDEIRAQLKRILASAAFHNSKRYAAVLKYIVDQTLEGNGERLKERTIGMEVFDRPPDYDTATDHAVRSAVAEVRKRLAQYYLSGAQDELRIEVLSGSYLPQFRRRGESPRGDSLPAQTGTVRSERSASQTPAIHTAQKTWVRFAWIAFACAIVAATIFAVGTFDSGQDAFDLFWKPIFSSSSPVLLCIGNVEGGLESLPPNSALTAQSSLTDFHGSPANTVNSADAFTMAKFAGLLKANGRDFRLASQSDATFTDLQDGPAILVGLFNNNWTVRLVPQLRFTVERPTPSKFVIRDRNNPTRNDWAIDYATPYLELTKDYAIVLRMVDPKTEQTVMVAAGITVFGTSAAGDLLTSKNEMKKLAAIAPPGWEKKNMELVLSTNVIKGRSGPASIIASQFW